MKVNDLPILTERRRQKAVIMYHGTSDIFLNSILKNGLMANPPKKTFDDGGEYHPKSVASYGGVYLTNSREIARFIALDSLYAHGGNNILLIEVLYTIGSGSIDEDNILDAFRKATRSAYNLIEDNMNEPDYFDADAWESWVNMDTVQQQQIAFQRLGIDKIKNHIMSETLDNLNRTNVKYNKQAVTQLSILIDFWLDALYNLFDGDPKYYQVESLFNDSAEYFTEYEPLLDSTFRKIIESIMINTSIQGNDERKSPNVRITQNIGYRGKSRIIRIIQIPQAKKNKRREAEPKVIYQDTHYDQIIEKIKNQGYN